MTPTYEVAQREDGSFGLKCSDGRIIGTAKTEAEAQFGVDVATWQREGVIAELSEAARLMLNWASYETEYDGRTYEICHSCGGQDGAHHGYCALPTIRAAIAKAEGRS